MSTHLSASQAAELRALLKRKFKAIVPKVGYVNHPYGEFDRAAAFEAAVARAPKYVKDAVKARERIEAEVEKAGLRWAYSYRRSLALPEKADDWLAAQEEAEAIKRNEKIKAYEQRVTDAYEAALDQISMARIDGSVGAIDIVKAFEAALKP